ncbi:MAG TPA: hypothetical protein VNT92_02690 [Acidimicrobiia bacterium]|nr:hypothetical protein [Acidimicrobiia bacterium]
MPEYQPLEPIDPREAFGVTPGPEAVETRSTAASQAALLLAARAGVLGQEDEIEELERDAAEEPNFDLPDLRSLERSQRIPVEEATRPLRMSQTELRTESAPAVQEEMARTVDDLYRSPSFEDAAALFEAGMQSPHPLVRVAAAAGARETTRLRLQIRRILEEGAVNEDPLVSRLALEALRQIDPKDPNVQEQVGPQPPSRKRRRESSTAVLTHGTWASEQAWYQPRGDFYVALDTNKPMLGVHDKSFKWTGSYTDAGRRAAALALKQWIGDQGLVKPDLFAHSHGGTVANLATKQGVEFKDLFLLAWPVHTQWLPDVSKVDRIIDVRVKMDLVITLDRGGQRFPSHPKVEEHRNGWFDHPAPHEPPYWDEHDLWDTI